MNTDGDFNLPRGFVWVCMCWPTHVKKFITPSKDDSDHNTISGVSVTAFLYCSPDCPFSAVRMDQATWTVLAAMKNFSPGIMHSLLD